MMALSCVIVFVARAHLLFGDESGVVNSSGVAALFNDIRKGPKEGIGSISGFAIQRGIKTGARGEEGDMTAADECQSRLVSQGLPAAFLVETGLELFKSCDELMRLVKRFTPPKELTFLSGLIRAKMIQVREDETLQHLQEMRGDRYELKKLGHQQNGVIVDIGANVGDFTLSAALVRPSWQILAFEPSPETFFVMLWNLALNGVSVSPVSNLHAGDHPGKVSPSSTLPRKTVIAFNAALSGNGKDVFLKYDPHKSQYAQTPSEKEGGDFSVLKGSVMKSYRLDSVLEDLGISEVDLLKIDCENCEYQVLPTSVWVANKTKVKHIVGEIHWHTASHKEMYKAAYNTGQVLKQRGCSGIDAALSQGLHWDGTPGTDVCKPISC